jgi:hypothetical protein
LVAQYLQRVGFLLPSTLTTGNDEVKLVVFLSDEIFAKNIRHPLFASLHFSRISRKGAKKGNEEKLWQFYVLLNAVNANG